MNWTACRPDGAAVASGTDGSGTDGSAILGGHDRIGPLPGNWAKSWNFSHPSNGCSPQGLVSTGGAGRLCCFAAN